MSPLAGPLAWSTAYQTACVYGDARLRAQMTLSASPFLFLLLLPCPSVVSLHSRSSGFGFAAGGWR
jgi:hypothetical protein